MPDLGDKLSVRCSDGRTRTGTVVYINPYRIFAVLQFDFWREAFFLSRPDRQLQQTVTDENLRAVPHMAKPFTPDEDRMIMESGYMVDTARELGRTVDACYAHKQYLRKKQERHARKGLSTPSQRRTDSERGMR